MSCKRVYLRRAERILYESLVKEMMELSSEADRERIEFIAIKQCVQGNVIKDVLSTRNYELQRVLNAEIETKNGLHSETNRNFSPNFDENGKDNHIRSLNDQLKMLKIQRKAMETAVKGVDETLFKALAIFELKR